VVSLDVVPDIVKDYEDHFRRILDAIWELVNLESAGMHVFYRTNWMSAGGTGGLTLLDTKALLTLIELLFFGESHWVPPVQWVQLFAKRLPKANSKPDLTYYPATTCFLSHTLPWWLQLRLFQGKPKGVWKGTEKRRMPVRDWYMLPEKTR
jgi:hypothetical protein